MSPTVPITVPVDPRFEPGTSTVTVPIIVSCNGITAPVEPPSISIPNYGVMSKAWTTLARVPSAMEMLSGLQDSLALALAPVRRYLEIVEVLGAFKNCQQAVVNAITQLSPDPIFDCLKQLMTVIPRVLAWMPPLSYVVTGLGIAEYCIDLTDELIAFYQSLDRQMGNYVDSLKTARLLEDTELEGILTCAMSGINARLTMSLDLLAFIKPVNDALMDMFLRLLPGGDTIKMLRQAKEAYSGAAQTIAGYASSARENPLVSLPDDPFGTIVKPPGMGQVVIAMNQARTACVTVYNVLAPFVGQAGDKQTRPDPVFTYF